MVVRNLKAGVLPRLPLPFFLCFAIARKDNLPTISVFLRGGLIARFIYKILELPNRHGVFAHVERSANFDVVLRFVSKAV